MAAKSTLGTSKGSKNQVKDLSLAEQKKLVAEQIQRFTALEKENGSLTIEEINDNLPAEIMASEALDLFMQGLDVNGVQITDAVESDSEDDSKESGDEFFLADPEKDDDDEDKKVKEDAKGNDPVRLYLRKMGSVSLLTREGEVNIAKRIEDGERKIVKAILFSPMGTEEIILLGQRVAEGRIKVKQIFRGLEDEETQYEEAEYLDKINELIGEVKKYEGRAGKDFERMRKLGHK